VWAEFHGVRSCDQRPVLWPRGFPLMAHRWGLREPIRARPHEPPRRSLEQGRLQGANSSIMGIAEHGPPVVPGPFEFRTPNLLGARE